MAEGATRADWRGIDELAALVGAYCWTERRLFAITGEWATAPRADERRGAELRVWCAATSRRHGALAARWEERLPRRAGVDAAALVAAPSGPLAPRLEELAVGPDLRTGVSALVEGVLPALDAVYAAHLRTASPVSEGPVLEVLAGAHREVPAEIRGGRALMKGLGERAGRRIRRAARNSGEFFERVFNETGVFPAVRPS